MVPGERTSQEQVHSISAIGPRSWWSWRPGIQPRNALIIGGLLSMVALLLGGIGLVTLVLGVLDSVSPPQQVQGTVLGHTVNALDGQPHMLIRIRKPGFPGEVSPVVSNSAYHAMHNGSSILLDYSPHLHVLYALENAGQRYTLPGASIVGDLFGSLALLLIGAILLPYPAVLMIWGWRDLFGDKQRQRELRARVVGLRAAIPNRRG